MAAPSTEKKELQLVETVEFKILGVANKEQKLHELLQRYLAPLILKAASDHASVRGRVRRPGPDIIAKCSNMAKGYPNIDSSQNFYSAATVCNTKLWSMTSCLPATESSCLSRRCWSSTRQPTLLSSSSWISPSYCTASIASMWRIGEIFFLSHSKASWQTKISRGQRP